MRSRENRKEVVKACCRKFVSCIRAIAICAILIASIVGITLRRDESALWSALLGVSLGYLLPQIRVSAKARMTHFYMTLPSNSSLNFFPENTMADYTTKLMTPVELDGQWELAMTEISYHRSWFTVPKDGVYIKVNCSNCSIKPSYLFATMNDEDLSPLPYNIWDFVVIVHVDGGYYESIEALVKTLQDASDRAFASSDAYSVGNVLNAPKFYYNALDKRIRITLEDGMIVTIPSVLETILGIAPTQNPIVNSTKSSMTIAGDSVCDIHAGIHSLYVYCDILEHIPVGDTRAPLLRIVDIDGAIGSMQVRRYERPRYVPIQLKQFDSIQIVIRDDLGEPVSFEFGKLMVTLHFRRAQNQYFL